MSAPTAIDELRASLTRACADVERVAGVECFVFSEHFVVPEPRSDRRGFTMLAGDRAFVGLLFDEPPPWLQRIQAFRSMPVTTPVTTEGYSLSLNERITPAGDRAAAAVAALRFFVEMMIDVHLVRHPEDERALFPVIDDDAIGRIFGGES